MNKFTKIVATISDRRCDVEFLRELYAHGMNVVRMNSAHLQLDGFKKIIENVRAVSSTIGILMDTKGPEIRTTTNESDAEIEFRSGDRVVFVGNPEGATTHDVICLSYGEIANDVRVGARILIDDGELSFLVDDVRGSEIYAVAENGGTLGSRKSVNIPGVKIALPSLTERDRRNIGYAIDLDVDFIAHSFVRSAEDVLDIQRILDARNSHIKIISKIENQEGIDNFDEILEVSYGIMIARGDLGIEVAAERIPVIQHELIKKCIDAHKPVIVATQMLHSMINNPRPTRAEVSDIANAVTQHTDALMLSGETAYGNYPVEAIATMSRVAMEMERSLGSHRPTPKVEADQTSFLARQAVVSTNLLGTRAILTDSYTGRTARYISSYRASYPTLAICYYPYVVRLLALSYGVSALYQPRMETTRVYLQNALTHLIEGGRLTLADRIAYLGGSFGEGHGTSFLEINSVEAIMENFQSYTLPNLEDASH
ncbi:pyruvate kinase [Muribaculum intestinale]|uniref:pyruvate kinase n=1 Tax=Muribaculum intestinale TaxID=1796646 RepID=UPI003527F03B